MQEYRLGVSLPSSLTLLCMAPQAISSIDIVGDYPGEELSIDEVGFSESCIKGLKRVGVSTVRDIFDMAERFHDGVMGGIHGEGLNAYIEAAKHLHAKGMWPWPEDIAWFEADN
jgi:hypothetical protein